MNRSRFWYFAGICLIVALGLASRRYASSLPVFLARYAGDTLWAMVMFGVVGLLAAEWSSFRVAVATLMQSYAIEGSQLSHASWLDAVRQTRFGGLVLGYGFLWSDIVCYTVGVGICVGLELMGAKWSSARTSRRVRGTAALVLGLGVVSVSCVPVVANLAKGEIVPQSIAPHTGLEGTLLVLPLWTDMHEFTFRDPYVISASAVGTPSAGVPRRMGFYFESLVACGGPSNLVIGYLVVTDTGRIVWSDMRGERVSSDVSRLKAELEVLLGGAQAGPGILGLAQMGDAPIGFHASQERRARATEFLAKVHE